jgi:hypothetical protein
LQFAGAFFVFSFINLVKYICVLKQDYGFRRFLTRGKTNNETRAPRKSAFDCQRQEIKDTEKCAAAMGTQRVNAVTEGIRLLKKRTGLGVSQRKAAVAKSSHICSTFFMSQRDKIPSASCV